MYGKIIAYNPETKKGIIECNFDQYNYWFYASDVIEDDRDYLRTDLNVQFEAAGKYAIEIETVSGSYKRFNRAVREERTAKTLEIDVNDCND